MPKTTLNFFGEEVTIETPKDLASLRSTICEKYLFGPSDAAEIILFYIKDNKKTYIINGNDYSSFKASKIPTIFLDINQNSRIYLDSASQVEKEKENDQKELDELNHKFEKFCQKKSKTENAFEKELIKINHQLNELNKKKSELIQKRDEELHKLNKEQMAFQQKIYDLQQKLSLPTTVSVPEEDYDNIILKAAPMDKKLKKKLRYIPKKCLENQNKIKFEKFNTIACSKQFSLRLSQIPKMIEKVKMKSIAKAKAHALEIGKTIEKIEGEKLKMAKIENVRLKSIAKAKAHALKLGKDSKSESLDKSVSHLKLKLSQSARMIENVKKKSIAKAKLHALKIAKNYNNVVFDKERCITEGKEYALKLSKSVKVIQDVKEKSIAKEKLIAEAKAHAFRFAQMAKKMENAKLKSIAKAKSINEAKIHVLKLSHSARNIENVKQKSISKAKTLSLKLVQSPKRKEKEQEKEKCITEARDHAKKYSQRAKMIEKVKKKSIASARAHALKIGQNAQNCKGENIISVFAKVNEILAKTIDKVTEVAKEGIIKKDNKAKNEKEAKLMKEKEKRERIKKMDQITTEVVKEINNLTDMVISQSYSFIRQINESN